MDKFRIDNSGEITKLYILNAIGGYDGIQATDVVPEIHKIRTDKIDIHVDSLGGDVFQATAIFNALQNHPAYKTAYVDGVAASAASFLIQAADHIVMGHGTQLMIHDAMGVFNGNVSGLDEFRALLDSTSNNIAAFYANRAGGDVKTWRKRMQAETWYTAEEAVAAGLADEVAGRTLSPANLIQMELTLTNSGFNYKGRNNAPDPDGIPADKVTSEEPVLLKDALLNALRDALKEA
jgi:ATP-dependent protease ClpP protease subunit